MFCFLWGNVSFPLFRSTERGKRSLVCLHYPLSIMDI